MRTNTIRIAAVMTFLPLAACVMPDPQQGADIKAQYAVIPQIQPDTDFAVAKGAAMRSDRLAQAYANALGGGLVPDLDRCRAAYTAEQFPGGDALAQNAWQIGLFAQVQRCEYRVVTGQELPPPHAIPQAPITHRRMAHRKSATAKTPATSAPAPASAGTKVDLNW
jgi:hypothetical protein